MTKDILRMVLLNVALWSSDFYRRVDGSKELGQNRIHAVFMKKFYSF